MMEIDTTNQKSKKRKLLKTESALLIFVRIGQILRKASEIINEKFPNKLLCKRGKSFEVLHW